MPTARPDRRRWSIRPLTGGIDQLKVSAAGFTAGGPGRHELLVVTGSRGTLDRAIGAGSLRRPAVRFEFDATSTRIRRLAGADDQPGERVLRVRPKLSYQLAGRRRNLDRILTAIRGYAPKVLLVEAQADDDLDWAGALAGALDIPTVVTMDVGPAGRRIGDTVVRPGPGQPCLFAAGRADELPDSPTTGVDPPDLPAPGYLRLAPRPAIRLDRPPPPPAPRHVNTLVHSGQRPVQPGEVLATGQDCTLGVGIGPKRGDSLLGGDTVLPDRLLPEADRWLDLYLRPHGLPDLTPARDRLFLPVRGPAFTCRRTRTVDHTGCTAADHQELARFPFRTPDQPGQFGFTIHLYAGAALIHAQDVALSAGTGPGATATVTFRLADDLGRLPDLTDRTVSTAVGAGTLTVNDVDGQPFEFEIGDAQWSHAAANVRRVLTDVHLVRDQQAAHGWRPRYDLAAGVPLADYTEHLSRLAVRGYRLFTALFPGVDSRVLPWLLKLEAAAAGVPLVQIARPSKRSFAVPWPVVYSLPVLGAKPVFWPCPSVAAFGPGGGATWPPPARCPHADAHERRRRANPGESVLCPFGFWGYAYHLEVPEPPRDRDVDEVVATRPWPPAMAVATGAGLDPDTRRTHLAALREQAPGFPAGKRVVTRAADLPAALAGSTMDVVYVLCHSDRDPVDESDRAPDSTLVFRDQSVVSSDVNTWAVDWPHDHWHDRRPLVVLNACHTVELTQSTLGNFATAFVNAAGAAGVVGTEALIEQRTASMAMEAFLTEFLGGAPVGAAIRLMRWRLLAQGSVMGLAYTPYCSATLRLRP